MKKISRHFRDNSRLVMFLTVAAIGLGVLMLYKLGSLIGGLSRVEVVAATTPVGWHGIYHHPLYLPIEAVRSVVFFIFNDHGQTLTRLPNTLFGVLSIVSFVWLIKLWHSTRTAILAGLLFATGAWTLHVSRLASFDVLYLWATPTLLLTNTLLKSHSKRAIVWFGSLFVWQLMLYIPGLVWLIVPCIFLQRKALNSAWRHFSWKLRLLYFLQILVGLPLLVIDLLRPDRLITWLGLPVHFAGPLTIIKHFVGVPVHLFIRGPQYPDLWLGRVMILDIFTLATCLIGIYFYAAHWKAARSRLLLIFVVVGGILVGLGGPVSLSLLVPLLYIIAATGIAYLLHEWLQIFPLNPVARSIGLGIVILAVVLSCTYNLRAYFVAWPHNTVSRAVFHYHR